MLICFGVFETWSSPRITCVIPSQHVLHRRGEVVRRPAVGADEHDVLELLVRQLDAAADDVVPGGRRPRRACGSGSRPRPRTPCPRRRAARATSRQSSMPVELERDAARPSRARASAASPGSARPPPRPRGSCRCSRSAAGTRRPACRAKSQLKRNVRTPPMWRKPVGLGAMRTRTVISVAIAAALVARQRRDARSARHVARGSRPAGIARTARSIRDPGRRSARDVRRAALHAEPAHVAADEPRPGDVRPLPRAPRRDRDGRRPLPRALPLQPRRAGRRRSTRSRVAALAQHDGGRVRDRRRRRRLPRRLASRLRLRARASSASCPRMEQVLELCDRRRPGC